MEAHGPIHLKVWMGEDREALGRMSVLADTELAMVSERSRGSLSCPHVTAGGRAAGPAPPSE